MHIPRMTPAPGVRRSLARAHTVDALWNRLLRAAASEALPAFLADRTERVRDSAFPAAARHLAVQCRRHAASVYRAVDAFPPYVMAAKAVAHP